MGKRRATNTYRLAFDESNPVTAGLEIVCRKPTLDQLFEIAQMGDIKLSEALSREGIIRIRNLCGAFPERIIEWNYQDEDGNPLPPTFEVFAAEDYTFQLPVINAWIDLIRADPENARELGTEKLDITNIPMEEISAS